MTLWGAQGASYFGSYGFSMSPPDRIVQFTDSKSAWRRGPPARLRSRSVGAQRHMVDASVTRVVRAIGAQSNEMLLRCLREVASL
jgi:hypothetical protein